MKISVIGDGMIKKDEIAGAAEKLSVQEPEIRMADWIMNKVELQRVRRDIEQHGPSLEHLPREVIDAILEAEMVLAHYAPIPGDLIREAENLKIIGICRAGYENVDVTEATRRGVIVFRVMGRNAEAVSDFTLGLLIAEARNIARSHMLLKQDRWLKPREENIHDLKGRTVGIMGFGRVGRLVARKLSGFDVKILVYDPYVDEGEIKRARAEPAALEDLFKQSDYICIHARLTDETRGMIDDRLISLMKPTSYIINTARAEIVDEEALCKALEEKRIAGAALDVFWVEPPPKGHILTRLDNVTLTSHLAGTTIESLTRSPELLVEDINRLLRGGRPLWVVNPSVLEKFNLESVLGTSVG